MPSVLIDFTRNVYLRSVAPLGAQRVEYLLRRGLPDEFRPALEFLFTRNLTPEDTRIVQRVEAMREELARGTEPFQVVVRDGSISPRTPRYIAEFASVTRDWGTFLYLCAKGFRAETILELGSCAGISGSYLASAPTVRELMSIERTAGLAATAKAHIQQVSSNAKIIHASFDDVLDDVLASLKRPLDLYYIDGNHWYEPTLRYFQKGIPFFKQGALVVFDDIHWSKEMWEAWLVLRAQHGFSYTIDVGRFGLCVWQGDSIQPQQHNLAKFAGWFWNYAPR